MSKPRGSAITFTYVLVVLLFCLSCRNTEPKELLLGSWELMGDTAEEAKPIPPWESYRRKSYTFLNDSLVDTKSDYYNIVTLANGDREFRFIGTITKYKIVNDSLRIFDLTRSTWETGRKLVKILTDTLILEDSWRKEIFVRNDYKVDDKNELDQIALSSSGCFGSCPIANVIISENGDFIFYGERYIEKLGFYEGHIPREIFLGIKNQFGRVGIEKLKREYETPISDLENISTTFCNRNKFINSIDDYGPSGPDELVWSYSSLRYLFQKLELKKLDSTKIPYYLNVHYFRFEREDQVSVLTQSESFLLWNYLRKGAKVQYEFEKRFSLNFVRNYTWAPSAREIDGAYKEEGENKGKEIMTDGRYYTFKFAGQKPVTIDIGFNYFDVNKQFFEFRERTEYD